MTTTIIHVSDLHFGWPCDLEQVAELVRLAPELEPDAIAISGDLTQRARHGEFQRARVFIDRMNAVAPTLVDAVLPWLGRSGLPNLPRLLLAAPAGFAAGLFLAAALVEIGRERFARSTRETTLTTLTLEESDG